MRKIWIRVRKTLLPVLCLMLLLAAVPAFGETGIGTRTGAGDLALDDIMSDTEAYLLKTVNDPVVGTSGGEWAVIGLARADSAAPGSYFDKYYKNLEAFLKKNNGVLHERKYTEYSRVVLALTAMGKDPRDVAGYDLLTPLSDFENVKWQGINGSIFALLALDSGEYDMPQAAPGIKQATRDLYIEEILGAQLANGGFALSGTVVDPDVTGMALQALAKYQGRDDVKTATEKALQCLSGLQNAQGGFTSWNTSNSESTSQVLSALCELGISWDDSRFVKNGMTLLDNLLSYYEKGKGFSHLGEGSSPGGMATEQAFYTLVNVKRISEGKDSLYRMTDVKKEDGGQGTSVATGRNKDVKEQSVINQGKSFADIDGHRDQKAIEGLAERGIINGKTENAFAPDQTMKRSEFAAIVTRALGLTPEGETAFRDISPGSWYADYVGTAYSYGIVKGTSEDMFTPGGTITKEQAAVMIARAAELCGLDTAMETDAVRNVLAQFTDYTKVSEWARASLAYCYEEGFLSQEEIEISPQRAITRCEIAQILYRMLDAAELI